MIILLNCVSITEYYVQNRNEEFLSEKFSNDRSCRPYYILKILTQMDELFLRYGIVKKWTNSETFVRKKLFLQTCYLGGETFV
jgi:hypothetical protein